MNARNSIFSFLIFVLINSTGCKKLVQVAPPRDSIVSEMVFSNDSMASSAVTGLYSTIMSQTKYFLNGGMSLFPGLSADELTRTASFNTEDQFSGNTLLPANVLLGNNIWKAGYNYLYQCNLIIEGLQRATGVTIVLKDRLMGEARFVRALCYYYLVNLFGDVPLVITADATKNALLSRSPVNTIYEQITADLENAYTVLPETAVNTRPNKISCRALLARVYLYLANWSVAESNATAVIGSGTYQMVTNPDNVFKHQSTETIFQWAPVLPNINAAEGNFFVPPGTARPAYVVTKTLLDAFETGDLRRNSWIKTVKVSGIEYQHPYKYKLNASNYPPGEYNIVLRLAEQYLIRAEARAQQDNIPEAVTDINVIRSRAGLPPVPPGVSKSQCLAAIEQEKRIELFAEWGHRWFDLKRLKKADAVLSIVKPATWQTTDQLYPIPLSEIENDPNLKQNDGY